VGFHIALDDLVLCRTLTLSPMGWMTTLTIEVKSAGGEPWSTRASLFASSRTVS
jgi:hypothetical protein